MPDLIGSTFGPYRILEQIGLGGMATVYKAYQPGMDRLVALKVLPHHHARDPRFVKRFEQEARVIAKLEHRNIVPVYDSGEQDGTAYLAMRYLQAGTVKEILSHGPLPLPDAAKLLSDIASALDYAHSQGIIHRDVKPSNVLVDKQGNAYLTDFGIAKVIESTMEMTGSAALGTPAYMAPEQTLGKAVTPQSDVYSLGVMLYEMVTGKPPFEADTPMAIALMHVHEPLPLPRKVKPDLPEAVELVILKALAKEPKDRYGSAGELAHTFVNVVGVTVSDANTRLIELAGIAATEKGSEEVTYDIREEIRKRESTERTRRVMRWIPWVVGALVVVALVIGLFASWQGQAAASSQLTSVAFAATETANAPTLTPSSSATRPADTSTPRPTLPPTETQPSPTDTPIPIPTAVHVDSKPLLEDDFSGGLTSPWEYFRQEQTWTVVKDETGNSVLRGTTSESANGATLPVGSWEWTDYAVELRVKLLGRIVESGSSSAPIDISVRTLDYGRPGCNRYVVELWFGEAGISTNKDHAGEGGALCDNTVQADYVDTPPEMVENEWYSLRVEVYEAELRVLLDGAPIVIAQDVSSDAIRVGRLGLSLAPGTVAYFDDVRIVELTPRVNESGAIITAQPTYTTTPVQTPRPSATNISTANKAINIGWSDCGSNTLRTRRIAFYFYGTLPTEQEALAALAGWPTLTANGNPAQPEERSTYTSQTPDGWGVGATMSIVLDSGDYNIVWEWGGKSGSCTITVINPN